MKLSKLENYGSIYTKCIRCIKGGGCIQITDTKAYCTLDYRAKSNATTRKHAKNSINFQLLLGLGAKFLRHFSECGNMKMFANLFVPMYGEGNVKELLKLPFQLGTGEGQPTGRSERQFNLTVITLTPEELHMKDSWHKNN